MTAPWREDDDELEDEPYPVPLLCLLAGMLTMLAVLLWMAGAFGGIA